MSSEQCRHGVWIVGIGHNPCVECSSRGKCARCGGEFPLSPDGTCWPCAVAYRDDLIDDYRSKATGEANTLPSFGQQIAWKG